ncbi:hypothetical protein EC988_007724, partial [Linderina pennispora]
MQITAAATTSTSTSINVPTSADLSKLTAIPTTSSSKITGVLTLTATGTQGQVPSATPTPRLPIITNPGLKGMTCSQCIRFTLRIKGIYANLIGPENYLANQFFSFLPPDVANALGISTSRINSPYLHQNADDISIASTPLRKRQTIEPSYSHFYMDMFVTKSTT